ncbi:MAG: VWA domain-containing protein [Acidobacteriaceae bacterium]|nr:VWA domain-containing protein [Acidobacteriaceae bacterium]
MRITGRILLPLFVLSVHGQQVGQNAPLNGGSITFTTGAQLVIETVTVTSKDGKPVSGLTAKDFAVTENGAPQSIRFFEYQTLPTAPELPAELSKPADIHVYDKLSHVRITPDRPDAHRYKDHRLLALYFDMTAMPAIDQLRALAAAKKFVGAQMTATDLIAIMRYSGGAVDVLQDFTNDRGRLLSILETMIVGEGQGFEEDVSDASSADTGAAFGQDDTEFNIFNADRQLSALQTAATMLGQLSEKKSLIYFASGMRLNRLNNQAQLHATINAALRSGVTFWPIDARGLVAQAPLGDASQGSAGGVAMYSGASALAVTTNFQQSQDTLYALASDTGGKTLLDNNDLALGIVQARDAVSSYYVIGFYTSNTAPDGKFRRIKIALNKSGVSTTLDYRQGYYGAKQFDRFNGADKERQLEDALMLGDPITELTIAMEIDYFQLNRAEYFVPVVAKIPGRELVLAKSHGAEHTLIDFIGEVKDEYGTTITNVRDKVSARLTGTTSAELAKRPIEYETAFTLLPGKYTIKFLARDDQTGRIGTFQTTFVIPDLNKEVQRIAISSVVLSSQRVALQDALYSVKENKAVEEANPLEQDGQKLIPSVTRVFRSGRDMYVYLQAYEHNAAAPQPLLAFVTLYRGSTKVLETNPVRITNAMNNRLKTMPISFNIALGDLPRGEYNCQITVLDPDSRKAAFWQAPIVVVS